MSRSGIFFRFIVQVVQDNRENEAWWLVGTILRALHANLLSPKLLVWLIDEAIGKANVEYGLLLASIKVAALFVDQ